MTETGLHITFPGGREAWIEFDGESHCDPSLSPMIFSDVVFFAKGKPNRLTFNALVDCNGTITDWSLVDG